MSITVPRLYYGWYIVGIAVLANMLVVGTTFSAFGLFVLPVSSEFQLTRANMNTAMIFLNFGSAALAPVLGRLLDRFQPPRIMLVCAVLLGLSFVCLGLSRSISLSAAVVAIPLALGVQGCGALTMSVLIARWFVAQRGRAMALSVIGMSLGNVVVAPLVGMLIENYGWRAALLIVGGVVATLLVTVAFFVRGRPGPADIEPNQVVSSSAHTAAAPMKVGTLLRMAPFWLIALSSALALAVAQTLVITLVPLARQEGLTLMQATSLVSIMGGAAIGAKLLLAVVADRVDRIVALSGLFLLGGVLNAAMLISEGYLLLIGCAVFLGLAIGTIAPLLYALLADRFGSASFGTVRGLTLPISGILSAVAIRVGGEIFDRTGGYDLMFTSFIAAQIVAALLMFATRFARPTPAAIASTTPVGA